MKTPLNNRDENSILEQMIRDQTCCGGCNDLGTYHPKIKNKRRKDEVIHYLASNMPYFSYVRDQMINYIFSDGLTTGNDRQDEMLNEWLYQQNILGDTNYKVLQDAIASAFTYGNCGVRWLSKEDGIINIHSTKFAAIRVKDTEYYGFKRTVGYIVSNCGERIYDVDLDQFEIDLNELNRSGMIIDKDRKLIILSTDELLNLKNGSGKNGESVFAHDQQRTELLINVYERLNYDVEYDGPGRIVLRLKDGYEASEDQPAGTSEIMDNTKTGREGREEKARKEIKKIGEMIKESSSDNVIALSSMFADSFEHLPRTTKATEFFTYLTDNESTIAASLFGVAPALFGLGKIAGNVSMEKIIDNAMLNTVIPKREMFAIQISSLLAPKLGLPKIYFDKYNMQQSSNENDDRSKIVDMIVKLSGAGYTTLANGLAQLLSDDIGNVSRLRALTNYWKEKTSKLLGGKKHEHDRTSFRRSKDSGTNCNFERDSSI